MIQYTFRPGLSFDDHDAPIRSQHVDAWRQCPGFVFQRRSCALIAAHMHVQPLLDFLILLFNKKNQAEYICSARSKTPSSRLKKECGEQLYFMAVTS